MNLEFYSQKNKLQQIRKNRILFSSKTFSKMKTKERLFQMYKR